MVGFWHAEEEGPPAERVLGRVAEVLCENPLVLPDGGVALLTFSGGVGRWQPGDDSGTLLSKADDALQRAKWARGGGGIEHTD